MHKILLLVTSLILVSCQSVDKKTQDLYLKKSEAYEAKITRDIWGVPHVYGKTDADAAFGLAFAHAEDDFKNIAGEYVFVPSTNGFKRWNKRRRARLFN